MAESGSSMRAMSMRLRGQETIAFLEDIRDKGEAASQESSNTTMGGEATNAMNMLRGYRGELDVSVPMLQAAYTVFSTLAAETEPNESENEANAPSDLSPRDKEALFWSAVMQGAKPIFPLADKRKAEAKARIQASEAYTKRLRAREQEREYGRMVGNVHWGGAKPPEPETRGMYQASIALNMVTAAATGGFVAYYFGRQVFRKDSHCIIFASAAAVALLMVEMILYIIRTYEVERYKGHREKMELMGQRGLHIPQRQQQIVWGTKEAPTKAKQQ